MLITKNIFICSHHDLGRIESLLHEVFPLLNSKINEHDQLEIYVNKKEYVYMLNELKQFVDYIDSLPYDYEEWDKLSKQPIMLNIAYRYEILFDTLIECELSNEMKEIELYD